MAWLCLPSLKLVYIVALWFYSTPKWERILGVVLEMTHTLWSCSRIGHLRSGASPYLYATASTQWFIDILFITRDSRMSNKLCGRKTTKQNDFTLWNHSWLLSFCLTPFVVGFEKAETTSTSRNVRRTFHVPSGVPVQWFVSNRFFSHPIFLY